MLSLPFEDGEAWSTILPHLPCGSIEGLAAKANREAEKPERMTTQAKERIVRTVGLESYGMSEEQIVRQAKRSLWILKRHRADFARVTAERIRLIERFIANPRRNSPGMMRIIIKPFEGL